VIEYYIVVMTCVQVYVTQPQNELLVTVDQPLAETNQSLDDVTG